MISDVMGEGGGGGIGGRWGTWEELLLGGAVLRHGTGDWNTVASELRARTTLCPYDFTPEVCKAKYEELQKRYYGCKALFEELRKKRMVELKQALELSEGSIGSLESKLETLKAEKQDYYHENNGFSGMGFSVQFQKLEGLETSSKETSKDGLSAGSYTLETRTSWSSDCQIPAIISFEETNNQHEGGSHSPQQGKTSIVEKLVESMCGRQELTIKKKRGKRKRKDCNRDVNEVSVGESSLWDSVDAVTVIRSKENTSDCGEVSRSSGPNDQKNGGFTNDLIDDLMRHFSSVLEHKSASTYQHRLDSQKRGRYKKMIRKHVDFDTVRSRITSGSIMSIKELFRDMLLLANNALVFYSKNTREFKSAILLRELTTKRYRQYLNESRNKAPSSPTLDPSLTIHNPPVNPQGTRVPVRPGKRMLSAKVVNAQNDVTKIFSFGRGKPHNISGYFPFVPIGVKKKGFDRPRKVGVRNSNQQSIISIKRRRRDQTRIFLVETLVGSL